MESTYHYITTADERDAAINALKQERVIGIDTEGDSLYHYDERVSFIQIAGAHACYLFDPILLDSVMPLGVIFGNRDILKVFHGADYDIASLKRDFNFSIAALFDTSLAARAIGIGEFSLQSLIARFFGVTLSKTHQKSNWGYRPLKPSQLEYAQNDVAYLIRLHALLSEEVKKRGREDQLIEECLLMEEITWHGRPFVPDDYLKIKGSRVLSYDAQKVLRALVVLRDQIARGRNTPPFKVIGNEDLLLLAKACPKDDSDLARLFPKESAPTHRYGVPLLNAIGEGLKSNTPLPRKERVRRENLSSGGERLLARLKLWRNHQAEAEGVEPAMVIPSPVLKEIAMAIPQTVEVLSSVSSLRPWQVRRYGASLLTEITQAALRPL